MANYMVRVELKGNPSRIVYLKLHGLMVTESFLMQCNGEPLPHATYFGSSSKSRDELSSHLLNVIRQQIQYDVIVAETTTVSINGQSGVNFAEALGRYAASNPYSTLTGITSGK